MEIPDGLEVTTEERKELKVCKLNRALYGLKQSSNRWNKKFIEVAKSLGFENELAERGCDPERPKKKREVSEVWLGLAKNLCSAIFDNEKERLRVTRSSER